jgi:hypothetical protein
MLASARTPSATQTSLPVKYVAFGIATQDDGKIVVVARRRSTAPNSKFALARSTRPVPGSTARPVDGLTEIWPRTVKDAGRDSLRAFRQRSRDQSCDSSFLVPV